MAVGRGLAAALALCRLQEATSREAPGAAPPCSDCPPPGLPDSFNTCWGLECGAPAPLTLLPQEAGGESPACLDGTPYGFYFAPSSTNSTRWTIYMQQGGWCLDENDCYRRSNTSLGSSAFFPPQSGCPCMNVEEDGSMSDCNCLFMMYCDGASFSGFRSAPWPVPGRPGGTVVFRGIKNLDATLDWAFAHGLDTATELVLAGNSAGGLSTFLHADRVAARLALEAPGCTRVRAVPIVGFFLDHDNIAHDEHNYTTKVEYIYDMQNLTFGVDGGLMPACQAAYPDSPHYCFMSPHMQRFVKTPFFLFNSKYDTWQLTNELQIKWENGEGYDAMLEYGQDFMKQLEPVFAESANGAFITSCMCHGCPWFGESSLALKNETPMQLYADWLFGKSTGDDAFHVDTRGPNGDGELLNESQCLRAQGPGMDMLI